VVETVEQPGLLADLVAGDRRISAFRVSADDDVPILNIAHSRDRHCFTGHQVEPHRDNAVSLSSPRRVFESSCSFEESPRHHQCTRLKSHARWILLRGGRGRLRQGGVDHRLVVAVRAT